MTDGEQTAMMRPLNERECIERLRQHSLGRLGVVVNQYPMIFPVNYSMDGNLVTFRTAADTKFNAAHYANVTFEIDEVDPGRRQGWSVQVMGAVHVPEIGAQSEMLRMQDLHIEPLAPGDKDVWVQIVPDRITGREITNEGGFGFDPRGYV